MGGNVLFFYTLETKLADASENLPLDCGEFLCHLKKIFLRTLPSQLQKNRRQLQDEGYTSLICAVDPN